MASNPSATAQEQGLHLGGKFGIEGTNTPPAPKATLARTVLLPDGFTACAPDDMYRMDELAPGRREPGFPGLHNLHESVLERTLKAPPFQLPQHYIRAAYWDCAAEAVREALQGVPAGSHINVCANSGPQNDHLEKRPPWAAVPGAALGLLFVAQFRDDGPARPDLCADQPDAPDRPGAAHEHGARPPLPHVRRGGQLVEGDQLWLFFPPRRRLCTQAHHRPRLVRVDGDLYGWDEAVAYTRRPVVVVTGAKPARRFDYWQPGGATVYREVTWLQQAADGALHGGFRATTTRADVIAWDEGGIPGGPVDKETIENYSYR